MGKFWAKHELILWPHARGLKLGGELWIRHSHTILVDPPQWLMKLPILENGGIWQKSWEPQKVFPNWFFPGKKKKK